MQQQQVPNAYDRFDAKRQRVQEEETAAAAHDTIQEGRQQLPNLWLEETLWIRHLKGLHQAPLVAACKAPEATSKPLADERDVDKKALH